MPVERHIRAWLETFIVGLGLCPFAAPLLQADNLRISISPARGPDDLRLAFLRELEFENETRVEDLDDGLLLGISTKF